jgi:hypothetical protein
MESVNSAMNRWNAETDYSLNQKSSVHHGVPVGNGFASIPHSDAV